MDTSREDVGIAIRSALLSKRTKQKFSLIVLVIISIIFIYLETIEAKPLNYFRSFIKDTIYRGSLVVSTPSIAFSNFNNYINKHLNLYSNYNKLKEENDELKNQISKSDFLELENTQLRKLIDEQVASPTNLLSARVMIDKQSPYLNSFIINIGTNKNVKKGMATLDGKNFVGRIVDVNFFSSRVLLVSDLNSKIPVIVEPSGHQAILSGRGSNILPTLEFLPENHTVKDGDKVYTSGKEGIFLPGIPIGEIRVDQSILKVILFSDLSQITFLNINLEKLLRDK
jgi:rod shape-determining protein MreC